MSILKMCQSSYILWVVEGGGAGLCGILPFWLTLAVEPTLMGGMNHDEL